MYTNIDRLRLDMEVGNAEDAIDTGTGVSGATVMLQMSRDGGKSWGTELWATTGMLGDYKRVVEWRRLGRSRRQTIKVRITDPFKRVILGAYVNPPN
jgi:hypothetical protein